MPAGDTAVLAGEEGRHAARVRRVAAGEGIVLADGRGGLASCVVTAVAGATLSLAVQSRSFTPPPSPRLVVVQALAKGDRGELAVELMTELGVDEVVPWAAARSVTRWVGERGERGRQRWVATARAAAKQSQRSWLPTVAPLADSPAVAARIGRAGVSLVLEPAGPSSLAALDHADAGEVVLVVGPEGGVSPEELALFVAAGAHACHLGSEVLRTSTAGAAALAVLSAGLGRWA